MINGLNQSKQKQDITSVLSSKTDQQKVEKAEKLTAICKVNLEATMNNVFGCLPQWVGPFYQPASSTIKI
jgi:hypothetical protein